MTKDADRPAVDESEDAETDASSAEDEASEPAPDEASEPAPDEAAEASPPSKGEGEHGEQDEASDADDDEAGDADDDDEADDAKASDDPDADRSTSADTDGSSASPPPAAKKKKSWTSRLWWALPILMIVEFYAYGHNGRLEVCVGKKGQTDFSLLGQERTDANRWKFPRCETRLNLGLRSQYEEKVTEATKVACRGATIFRHQGEAKACVAGEQEWERRVEGHFVPPWDPAYYEHLFWFLQ